MKLLILGAGGHAKVLAESWLSNGNELLGFLDDDPEKQKTNILGFTVYSALSKLRDFDNHDISIGLGIGNNKTRWEIYQNAVSLGYEIPVVQHIKSIVSVNIVIGMGSVVFAGAIINTCAIIGEASIINTGAIIEHDCVLGNAVHISPGAKLAGGVYVGDFSWIGMGVTINEGIKIGRNSIIGSGAVVISDIPDKVIAVGVPAQIKRQR